MSSTKVGPDHRDELHSVRRKFKLGTRKSLLAWAQSSWVAREVERCNPGVEVELVGIETKGDRILDISLRKVEGKEFFVAELDEALRSEEVDFNVHSMKDLSLDRPSDFCLAAIPKREDARDLVIFGPGIREKLEQATPIRIGTSSPRRLENLPAYLKRVLPYSAEGRPAGLEFEEIRGNVNTRLGRLHLPEGDPKFLDAVVLAAAGLNRLWQDHTGRAELERLLMGTEQMWMPLSESPSAPAQGALAIECRAKDQETFQLLRSLHDLESQTDVDLERNVLRQEGGGCHQRFGASVIQMRNGDAKPKRLLWIKGARGDGSCLDALQWDAPPRPKVLRSVEVRNSSGSVELLPLTPGDLELLHHSDGVIIAHARAVTPELLPILRHKRCLVMGTASAEKLAQKGIWVYAHADGQGIEGLLPLLSQPRVRKQFGGSAMGDDVPTLLVLTHE